MDSFIDHLTRMVNVALANHMEPPFVALVSEENPYLQHIPNKTMWPALIVSSHDGVVKVGVYKDSQYIEQSPAGWSVDFIQVINGYALFESVVELNRD